MMERLAVMEALRRELWIKTELLNGNRIQAGRRAGRGCCCSLPSGGHDADCARSPLSPRVAAAMQVMRGMLLLLHNSVCAYFSGNGHALEDTLRKYHVLVHGAAWTSPPSAPLGPPDTAPVPASGEPADSAGAGGDEHAGDGVGAVAGS